MNEAGKEVAATRDRIQNWLMAEGRNIADEHRGKFESLPEERRRDILWKLRFRLH